LPVEAQARLQITRLQTGRLVQPEAAAMAAVFHLNLGS
jgi:hypothetical protein